MSLPNKIRAIVLTCDRYHVITRHMIYHYDRLWPNHPFVFHIPYQEVGGTDSKRIKYFPSPPDIKGSLFTLTKLTTCLAMFTWSERPGPKYGSIRSCGPKCSGTCSSICPTTFQARKRWMTSKMRCRSCPNTGCL